MKSSVHFAPNKHEENITKLFRKLHNDDQLTDVTLHCKDGTLKAHKLVLAASSPYFHRIFTENRTDHHTILIMHGVRCQHLRHLIELIYKGEVDVTNDALNSLYDLTAEFQLTGITGVLRDDHRPAVDACGRDTRFRGLKRVAVDYSDLVKGEADGGQQQQQAVEKSPNTSESSTTTSGGGGGGEPELPKLSAWARKQRKFKCALCPSSFKRSSHLTRHQLVHTGERPFACVQCEKAFSRHDKLKHHMRKNHGDGGEFLDCVTSPETGHNSPSPLPFIITNVESISGEFELDEGGSSAKRGRGRPRKYPIQPKPLVKRGRGRPRLNQPSTSTNGANYDITNLPYGDLNYLTMPLHQEQMVMRPVVIDTDPVVIDPVVIEPLVEIQTVKSSQEVVDVKGEEEKKTVSLAEIASHGGLKEFENQIVKIGECTISVANH